MIRLVTPERKPELAPVLPFVRHFATPRSDGERAARAAAIATAQHSQKGALQSTSQRRPLDPGPASPSPSAA